MSNTGIIMAEIRAWPHKAVRYARKNPGKYSFSALPEETRSAKDRVTKPPARKGCRTEDEIIDQWRRVGNVGTL